MEELKKEIEERKKKIRKTYELFSKLLASK